MNRGNASVVDYPTVLNWITTIQNATGAGIGENNAETMLATSLYPFAYCYAYRSTSTGGCASYLFDIEQVANESVCKLMLVYVRDPSFRFDSCGQLLNLLRQIVTSERRRAQRSLWQKKRSLQNARVLSLSHLSLDGMNNRAVSLASDPVSQCEFQDQVERCLSFLDDLNHRQIFLMLLSGFTRDEMAEELSVDRSTIRRSITQMRRILAPRTSHLKPQASSLKPQASKAC